MATLADWYKKKEGKRTQMLLQKLMQKQKRKSY